MKTIETVQNEINELTRSIDRSSPQESLSKIRNLQNELRELKQIQLLNRVNKEQKRLRNEATIVYNCEDVIEDILTNTASFHATKVKKYPKLATLISEKHCTGAYKNGKITEITIGRKRYQLYKIKYDYGKEDVYTKIATIEDFFNQNSIMPKELSIDEFKALNEAVLLANQELEQAIKNYKEKTKTLLSHEFDYWGLLSQSSVNLYKYEPQH